MPLILGPIPRARERPSQSRTPVPRLLPAQRAVQLEGRCMHRVVEVAQGQAFSRSLPVSLSHTLCVERELLGAALLRESALAELHLLCPWCCSRTVATHAALLTWLR